MLTVLAWTRHFTLTLSLNLPTQVIILIKWVSPANLMLEDNPAMDLSIPSRDASEISTTLMDLLAGLCMQT